MNDINWMLGFGGRVSRVQIQYIGNQRQQQVEPRRGARVSTIRPVNAIDSKQAEGTDRLYHGCSQSRHNAC